MTLKLSESVVLEISTGKSLFAVLTEDETGTETCYDTSPLRMPYRGALCLRPATRMSVKAVNLAR